MGGETMSGALTATQDVNTLQGKAVTITKDGDTVKYGGALVTMADVVTSNGVIHVIDKVVLPPSDTTTTTPPPVDDGNAGPVSPANERHVVMSWLMCVSVVLSA